MYLPEMPAGKDQIDLALDTASADITHEIRHVSYRPVGHGGYSDIYTGLWSSPDGELKVAIKVVRASPNDLGIHKIQRQLEKEMRMWKSLSHSNVQKLSGIYNGIGSLPALVSPWCENGNIRNCILRRASDPGIGPAKLNSIKLDLLMGVMSGVEFLHHKRIVHGDIKGDNILISDCGAPLLCDFGLARAIAELSDSTTQTSPKGTWRWMAPELCLVEGARPSYESDIWACGCLFIEVWTSLLPYHSKRNQQQFFLAVNAREGPCPDRPASMPGFVWARVQECCNFDARQRPLPSTIRQSLASYRQFQRANTLSINVGRAALSVTWLPDAKRVVVGCKGGSTYILNPFTGATLRLVGHTADVNQVTVSPNRGLVASCSDDRSIRLWDAETWHAMGTLLDGHTGWVWSVAFSPDGRHIVTGSGDNTIRVWSTETFTTALSPLLGHGNDVRSVAYSPDGSRIVSGSADETIRVWDARTGDPILTLSAQNGCVYSVSYSPDGSRIVSGCNDGKIRIWDALTGRLVGTPLEEHSHWVRSVAYSSDGTWIISGSLDHTIRVWKAASGACITTMLGHTDSVVSVAISPDGTRVASASSDGTVRIWDTTDE